MSERNDHRFNEEEFLEEVKKASRSGARSGRGSSLLLQFQPALVILGVLMVFVVPKINSMQTSLLSIVQFDKPAEQHDLVIENNGFGGYTAADFEEAILGDSAKQKKLQVFSQEVSDVSTITNTGLLNWGIFTKNQIITYSGTALYTVDLAALSAEDIDFNEEEKIITIHVPHAQQEEINIPEDRIKFGDTNRGLLAFGDIKMTPEQSTSIQAEARNKMQEKLVSGNTQVTADRFAKLAVWEMYSPFIKGVAKDYSLEVKFKLN